MLFISVIIVIIAMFYHIEVLCSILLVIYFMFYCVFIVVFFVIDG